jgi:thiamine biosynthesis protein ThiS
MHVTANGKQLEIETGTRLGDLLKRLEMDSERVAVERNRQIVPRADFGATFLDDGDILEIVQFVGGG